MLWVITILLLLSGTMGHPEEKELNQKDLKKALLKSQAELRRSLLLEPSLNNPSNFQNSRHIATNDLESRMVGFSDFSPSPCVDTDGTVLATFKEKCVQLTCQNGFITPFFAFGKDHCNCCEFNGKLFKEGDELPGVCEQMYCCDGEWKSKGRTHDCCKQCDVFGDPHIITFDARKETNNWYTFHSNCNYTLTQKLVNKKGTYKTDTGVYVKFGPWSSSTNSSRVESVTFTDNNNVAQVILSDFHTTWINGFSLAVNFTEPTSLVDGSARKTTIMMWKEERTYCRKFLGSEGIELKVCPHYVSVFAHELLYDKLGGLCGFFNEYDQDDHTTRDGAVKPVAYYPKEPSPQFIFSWLASKTNTDVCTQEKLNPAKAPDPLGVEKESSNTYNRFTPTSFGECANQNNTIAYYNMCYYNLTAWNIHSERYHRTSFAEACLYDLCNMGTGNIDSVIDAYQMLMRDKYWLYYYNTYSFSNPCSYFGGTPSCYRYTTTRTYTRHRYTTSTTYSYITLCSDICTSTSTSRSTSMTTSTSTRTSSYTGTLTSSFTTFRTTTPSYAY